MIEIVIEALFKKIFHCERHSHKILLSHDVMQILTEIE